MAYGILRQNWQFTVWIHLVVLINLNKKGFGSQVSQVSQVLSKFLELSGDGSKPCTPAVHIKI
jgi:hypothetical protein